MMENIPNNLPPIENQIAFDTYFKENGISEDEIEKCTIEGDEHFHIHGVVYHIRHHYDDGLYVIQLAKGKVTGEYSGVAGLSTHNPVYAYRIDDKNEILLGSPDEKEALLVIFPTPHINTIFEAQIFKKGQEGKTLNATEQKIYNNIK